jgi:signal transduction histidine kinase
MTKRTIISIALIVALGLILIILAVLQFQWSAQISEAAHARMQENLDASMFHFRQQFMSELQQWMISFQPDAPMETGTDWKSYADKCRTLLSGADKRLVRSVYLYLPDAKDGDASFLQLKKESSVFELIDWPSHFASIKEKFAASLGGSSAPGPAAPQFGWRMFCQNLLLVRPLPKMNPGPDEGPGGRFQPAGFLMIELEKDYLTSVLLPYIAQSAFGDPDGRVYRIAVVDESSGSILFRSDPDLALELLENPDARIALMNNPGERPDMRGRGGMPGSGPEREMRSPDQAENRPPRFSMQPPFGRPFGRGMAPIWVDEDSGSWALLARHREGSLDAAVSRLRRRNLAISFGSLILLAISMALIIIAARRAQRLARLQMEFVAGISHELRTPLAVICSAGDNLADGVLADSHQAPKKYGELIRSEGRKLAGMIEEILQFAGFQRGSRRLNLRPVQINEIVESALKRLESSIASGGFSVETSLYAGLPDVHADPDALLQAIQNLIQNALKYSGESRWLAVHTGESSSKNGLDIWIEIEDRGIGIEKTDLPHIFEPFYRGKRALSEQIHGAGLGLYMVQKTLSLMRATIDAKSAPGKGSKFTIHFHAASSLQRPAAGA